LKDKFISEKEEHEELERLEEAKQIRAAGERARILAQLGKDKLKLL
jgi:hypothetical protein